MNKNLSASRINTLNLCAQKHHYAYTLGLEKPGETQAQALGTAVHKSIEGFYNGEHNMPHTEGAAYSPEHNVAVDAFGTFSMLRDGGVKVIATEQAFDVPVEDERITDGWRLRGIIDVVAKIDGQIYVMDHKTTKRKWPIEKTSLSLQPRLYELAVQELYPDQSYGGSAYNFIQLGTSKGVPYANVTREFLPRNEAALATAFEEVISAIQRIENGIVYRNVTDACSWCEYKDLCASDMYGGDTDALIQLNYKKKER